jgi:hypothetical protein
MTLTPVSTKASKRGIAKMGYSSWSETVKHAIDGLSVVTAVGTLTKMLPAVAAVFTIIWTGIRIYESKTVQKLLGKDGSNAQHE